MRRGASFAAWAVCVPLAVLSGCGGTNTPSATHSANSSATIAPSPTVATIPEAPLTMPTTTIPAFSATVASVTAAQLTYTWRAGCPVSPSQLSMITMNYWGFDGQSHTGTMVVATSVVPQVEQVFSTLYGDRFPINSMIPEDAFQGNDNASMAADNTSGFNCRYAVAPGAPSWSVHAYGEAIDINPVQNPYFEGGQWLPAGGAAYANRTTYQPGMVVAGGVVTGAFASVGWYWGGRWTGSPDYQHFSLTGG